jgi:hypothetical protein
MSSSRKERARAWLQLNAPNDVDLNQLRDEVSVHIEKTGTPDEIAHLTWQAVTKDLLAHATRRRSRSRASRPNRSKPTG